MFLGKSNEKRNTMNMVKLKNGSEVPESVVATTMMNLECLMSKNPIAFYELVEKCKNPKHEMFGNTKKVAEELALMNSGSVHDITKNIVLSAVQGEELNMTLNSPVEKNSPSNGM